VIYVHSDAGVDALPAALAAITAQYDCDSRTPAAAAVRRARHMYTDADADAMNGFAAELDEVAVAAEAEADDVFASAGDGSFHGDVAPATFAAADSSSGVFADDDEHADVGAERSAVEAPPPVGGADDGEEEDSAVLMVAAAALLNAANAQLAHTEDTAEVPAAAEDGTDGASASSGARRRPLAALRLPASAGSSFGAPAPAPALNNDGVAPGALSPYRFTPSQSVAPSPAATGNGASGLRSGTSTPRAVATGRRTLRPRATPSSAGVAMAAPSPVRLDFEYFTGDSVSVSSACALGLSSALGQSVLAHGGTVDQWVLQDMGLRMEAVAQRRLRSSTISVSLTANGGAAGGLGTPLAPPRGVATPVRERASSLFEYSLSDVREGAALLDLEHPGALEIAYIRCVVLNYILTQDHENCFPVLAAVLGLTEKQVRAVESEHERRMSWLGFGRRIF
jgi:hypothetical protein